jgi:hypothetical protein
MENKIDDPRYPWTHSADFIRMLSGYDEEGVKLSRSNATLIRRKISKIMGLDDRYVAERIADYFLENQEEITNTAVKEFGNARKDII